MNLDAFNKLVSKGESIKKFILEWLINMITFRLVEAFGIFLHYEIVNRLFPFLLHFHLFFLLLKNVNHRWTFNICLNCLKICFHSVIRLDDYHGCHLVSHLVDKPHCFVREFHYLEPFSLITSWVQAIIHLWNNALVTSKIGLKERLPLATNHPCRSWGSQHACISHC
jgi:hypothetical protein